jgi:hypothetical protein
MALPDLFWFLTYRIFGLKNDASKFLKTAFLSVTLLNKC